MIFTDYLLFSDLNQFIIIGIIILISQIIYATLGFGSGMFAISIMAFLYGKLEFIVPFFTLVCLPTEILISYKDRSEINLKNTWIFLIGIIPALLVGSILLKNSENRIYLLILGSIILLLAIYYIIGEKRFKFDFKGFLWVPIFSIFSGVLGGLFGMAGPPLIFYHKHKNLNKRQFRVALLSIFVIMTFFRVVFYFFLKIITPAMILTSLSVVPFALIGLWLGNKLHHIVPENVFRILISVALGISGLLIILKNML